MAKKAIFGKVTRYQVEGKLYKDREKFLDAAAVRVFFKTAQLIGELHVDEENVFQCDTRRVRSMFNRREQIEARIRRRLDQIVEREPTKRGSYG